MLHLAFVRACPPPWGLEILQEPEGVGGMGEFRAATYSERGGGQRGDFDEPDTTNGYGDVPP